MPGLCVSNGRQGVRSETSSAFCLLWMVACGSWLCVGSGAGDSQGDTSGDLPCPACGRGGDDPDEAGGGGVFGAGRDDKNAIGERDTIKETEIE